MNVNERLPTQGPDEGSKTLPSVLRPDSPDPGLAPGADQEGSPMATQGRNGWVCLHRKSLDSMAFLSKKAEVWKVWSWCLMRARWQGGTLPIEYQSVKVLPGQFIYGRKEACEELLISERTFRTCITTLVAWGSITVKTTNKYSIATVVNWVTYQSRDGQNDQPTTNQRPQ